MAKLHLTGTDQVCCQLRWAWQRNYKSFNYNILFRAVLPHQATSKTIEKLGRIVLVKFSVVWSNLHRIYPVHPSHNPSNQTKQNKYWQQCDWSSL